MHHVAYRTDDIEPRLSARSAGLRLIDEEPRIGIRGSRVAFVHPKATGGVLTEIVQPAEAHDGRGDIAVSTSASRAGRSLPARVKREAYEGLRKALEDSSADRWSCSPTHDYEVALDLSQVVYVRLDTEDQRVGF